MSAKITGLEELSSQLEEASKTFDDIDGDFGTFRFDPDDPESIEAAIQQAEALVDARTASYSENPMISSVAEQLKESLRQGIIERAAAARLGVEED